MASSGSVDLVSLFQAVTQALETNQQSLDQADAYNQDHGSNMVQTFQTITGALQKKRGSSDSAALSYAARALTKSASSGSGKLYAQNLQAAAARFKGQQIDQRGALELLQMLIGGGQSGAESASAAGGDLLGSLLGGLAGGETAAPAAAQGSGGDALGGLLDALNAGQTSTPAVSSEDAAGGDLLGSLLGGLAGGTGGSTSQQGGGFGLQNLLAAGMTYLQASQSGQSGLESLVSAFAAGSGMGGASHRQQSTQVVVQAFLQALGALGGK